MTMRVGTKLVLRAYGCPIFRSNFLNSATTRRTLRHSPSSPDTSHGKFSSRNQTAKAIPCAEHLRPRASLCNTSPYVLASRRRSLSVSSRLSMTSHGLFMSLVCTRSNSMLPFGCHCLVARYLDPNVMPDGSWSPCFECNRARLGRYQWLGVRASLLAPFAGWHP